MRKLPLAYTCDRRWAEMKGRSAVVRHCGDCGCDVVNLSALDETTARALLEQQTETACVRFRYERNEIVFAKARRAVAMAAAAAVLIAATAGGADTSTPTPSPPPVRRRAKGNSKKHSKPGPVKKHDDCAECDGLLLPPQF